LERTKQSMRGLRTHPARRGLPRPALWRRDAAWERVSVEAFRGRGPVPARTLLNASTLLRIHAPTASLGHLPCEMSTCTLIYRAEIFRIKVGIAKFVQHLKTLKRVSPKIFLFLSGPGLTSIHVTAKHEFFDKFVQHRARIEGRIGRSATLDRPFWRHVMSPIRPANDPGNDGEPV
jgi:hypothetical protein